MISVQGKFLCNNVTEGFTFFMYNRDTKFERVTKQCRYGIITTNRKSLYFQGV